MFSLNLLFMFQFCYVEPRRANKNIAKDIFANPNPCKFVSKKKPILDRYIILLCTIDKYESDQIITCEGTKMSKQTGFLESHIHLSNLASRLSWG